MKMEILNSYPILKNRNDFSLITSCVLFCVFLVLMIISLAVYEFKLFVVFSTLTIVSCISMLYCGAEVPSGRLEYQVIISDDYPAKNLYEKYEVVKTEGKIWYIQDKEKNNEDVNNK